MTPIFRATRQFLQDARRDLELPHAFAAERVAFISVRAAYSRDTLVLLADGYHPVADEDYVDDVSVGAMMGQEAIRKALNTALLNPVGMFHVHMHDHKGFPTFSRTDMREQGKFVPDFFKVRRRMPHGALVLSRDRLTGRVWLSPTGVIDICEFHTVGPHTVVDIIKSSSR